MPYIQYDPSISSEKHTRTNHPFSPQASFGGARICDNGETYEGEAARTDPIYRGTGLFIFAKLRNILLRDGALPRWPNLQRVRIVTVNVESTLKLPGFHFRTGARRVSQVSTREIYCMYIILLNDVIYNPYGRLVVSSLL